MEKINISNNDIDRIIKKVLISEGFLTDLTDEALNLYHQFTDGKNPSKNSYLQFDGFKLSWVSNGTTIRTWKAHSGSTLLNTKPKDYLKLLKSTFTKSNQSWAIDKKLGKNFGPIPNGEYFVGYVQSRNNESSYFKLIDTLKALPSIFSSKSSTPSFFDNTSISRVSWGNYRAPIKPIGGTKTYGRSSFYIHGGNIEGSHGCIDLTSQMDDFGPFYLAWLVKNKVRGIKLIVKYHHPVIERISQILSSIGI